MPEDWSEIEIELIVADYFDMLRNELKGILFNKTEHRKKLIPLLKNRSHGSIEFKHQNISAILIELKLPFIRGYKPKFNYQMSLAERVVNYLKSNPSFEKNFEHFTDAPINNNVKIDFKSFIVDAPVRRNIAKDLDFEYKRLTKINYLEREQNNRDLGKLGEKLVVQFEKWHLISLGKESLADKIEWVSNEQGDGSGFDILSKNLDGSDKYIEVKTTKLTEETPIFFSKNEFDFSKKHSDQFHLYRLFNFSNDPKMFIKHGKFDSFCDVEAINFRGTF